MALDYPCRAGAGLGCLGFVQVQELGDRQRLATRPLHLQLLSCQRYVKGQAMGQVGGQGFQLQLLVVLKLHIVLFVINPHLAPVAVRGGEKAVVAGAALDEDLSKVFILERVTVKRILGPLRKSRTP